MPQLNHAVSPHSDAGTLRVSWHSSSVLQRASSACPTPGRSCWGSDATPFLPLPTSREGGPTQTPHEGPCVYSGRVGKGRGRGEDKQLDTIRERSGEMVKDEENEPWILAGLQAIRPVSSRQLPTGQNILPFHWTKAAVLLVIRSSICSCEPLNLVLCSWQRPSGQCPALYLQPKLCN